MKHDTKETYAEIEEKRTSKLGYLILSVLFIFLLIAGQTIYHDIGQIPEKPIAPSYCANRYTTDIESSYYDAKYDKTCTFSEIDRTYGIESMFKALEPDLKTIIQYNNELSKKNSKLRTKEWNMDDLLLQYDISLQETIANENVLMDKPEIRNQITSLRTDIEKLNKEIQQIENERTTSITSIQPQLDELKIAYDNASDDYKNKLVYYKIKVFILKLLFILPLFIAFLKYYLKYKKRDSPYTIIITPIFFATTILFLQIVLVLLYDIILEGLIEKLLDIFLNSSILRYVLYYLVVAIVILILGGIVYYIQKNIYDPKRVAIRSLRNNKCPNCSFDLNIAENFCPYCGREIKTKCPECNNQRYKDLKYCPYCDATNDDKDTRKTDSEVNEGQ